ncbi:MAG: PEP-CTERM sorting domain-containing protein [Kiritimatiellaceae bacterium]|nr:PEP-CTERM sorting domain-containing protein [Kiritimatiellaceae bacterium]
MNITATVLVSLCTLLPLISNAGLILSPGDSFDFEFNSISSVESAPLFYPSASYSLKEESPNTLLFTVFDGDINGSEIFSLPMSGGLGGGVVGLEFPSGSYWWPTLKGALRVEVLTGTIELDSFTVTTKIGSQYYEQTYAVPEPSSIALFLLGTGALLLRRNNFNKRIQPTGHSAPKC